MKKIARLQQTAATITKKTPDFSGRNAGNHDNWRLDCTTNATLQADQTKLDREEERTGIQALPWAGSKEHARVHYIGNTPNITGRSTTLIYSGRIRRKY